MFRHPLKKLGKKNRNIISGLMVGLASLFLLAFYLDIETSVMVELMIAVVLFISGIILLSVCFLFVIKGVKALLVRSRSERSQSDSESE